VTKSITPGQMVVKFVHDELVRVLQGDGPAEALKIDNPPSVILMVGLQGSGKTTTTAKLAKRLKDRNGKKVLLASLDTNRPAAMEQLAILGTQIGVDSAAHRQGRKAPSRSPSGPRPRHPWAAMTCCSWIPRAVCTSTKS
jgi:signal recognition particle subunit SRP54